MTGALGLVFLALLVWIAIRLILGNRQDLLATAPVTPEQEVALPGVGQILLMVEAPRLQTDYRSLEIELTEKGSGRAEIVRYRVLTAAGAVYGVTKVKVPLGRLSVPVGATYVVRVAGLKPGKDYSGYRLLFSLPYLRRIGLQVAGIVICFVGATLCLLRVLWLAGLLHSAR